MLQQGLQAEDPGQKLQHRLQSQLNVGSNRAEKYLPALPVIELCHGQGLCKRAGRDHRWCEVLASWLALIDDNYVNELRQAMTHDREIKQSEMTVPVVQVSPVVLLLATEFAEV